MDFNGLNWCFFAMYGEGWRCKKNSPWSGGYFFIGEWVTD